MDKINIEKEEASERSVMGVIDEFPIIYANSIDEPVSKLPSHLFPT